MEYQGESTTHQGPGDQIESRDFHGRDLVIDHPCREEVGMDGQTLLERVAGSLRRLALSSRSGAFSEADNEPLPSKTLWSA